MQRILRFFRTHWRHVAILLVLFFAMYAAYWTAIQSQFPGYSAAEVLTQGSSTSLQAIWNDPLNAPYKLLSWVLFKVGAHQVWLLRVVSLSLGLLSAVILYYVLRTTFSRRIAVLAGLLYLSSTGFLHAAHVGEPGILQLLGVTILLAFIPLYLHIHNKVVSVSLGVVVVAMLLYVPVMPWFVFTAAIVFAKKIRQVFSELRVEQKIAFIFIFLCLITPLVRALIATPSIGLGLLGLPQHLPGVIELAHNAKNLGISLFWHGTGPADSMVVGAPILNGIEIALIVIGVYVQCKKPRLKRNYFILIAMIFMMFIIIFGGGVSYAILTPVFALLMASGLYFLIEQWQTVFPLNPVARIIGVACAVLLVSISVLFHYRSFYVGWPHQKAAHEVFTVPQPTYTHTIDTRKPSDHTF